MKIALRGLTDPAVVRAITTMAACWGARVETTQDKGTWTEMDALVVGEESASDARATVALGSVPALVFVGNSEKVAADPGREIKFGHGAFLPETLRGSVLVTSEATFSAALPSLPGLEEGASTGGRPIWRGAVRPGGKTFVVATAPPRLEGEQRLAQIFNGETFLHALPVWLFLQALGGHPRWQPPPRRACLLVDDPNLHHTHYGCIDYRVLAESAQQRSFHVAFATVPLDGWWTSARAAQIFRENPGVLSLLVHGNDHRRNELAGPFSDEQGSRLVAQSLARTAAMERKSGLRIDRIMAPPHGVCSAAIMQALWQGGYAGMTTNRWSLWKNSPPATLPEDTGLRPADLLAGGLPVTSRFRFNSPICRNEVHLAALLGQPILPYGHHKDFGGGMSAVLQTADTVNALGAVRWMSMREVLETNFESRIEGETFHIRPFSRHVKGLLPAGTTRLQIELPPAAADCDPELLIEGEKTDVRRPFLNRIGEPVALGAGGHFEMRFAHTSPALSPEAKSHPIWKPRILLSRLAAEARDRLQKRASAMHR